MSQSDQRVRRLCARPHDHLLRAGASDERVDAVPAWREAPWFTGAERAALRLTEAMTRPADRSHEPVPDALWDEVAGHFDEKELWALILTISLTNVFNRVNTTIKEPVCTTWG